MNAASARDIFFKLVAHVPPDEWDRRLGELAGGDEELRRRVSQLLAAHREAGSSLGTATEPAATGDELIGERPGTQIGPYKLLEPIGEGGFGVVFMAEQQEPVRRKVALKVLKPGMDTRQVVARFGAERQALALMDHPNIAKVHDAGETDSGRPYFVMELVKGAPITDFCDQNRLPVRERLVLFADVCRAVQHAHQKGVIHRDLKPSNVLVTLYDGTPVPKVIDFGIAKATGQLLTDRTLFTGFGQLVGTPLYMSPEQAALSGLDVDTRSDVYSLGVLLYELLTGTTPFTRERLRTAGLDELRRIIREEEPPRPSTRLSTLGPDAVTASARRLSQLLRGELDWLVMKCLEKDRTRRYESAADLAGDVERYLHDEPVRACPPSARYRLGKFARRHKAGLVLAGLVLGFLVALGGVVGWVTHDRATRLATRRLEVARAVDEARAFCRRDRLPEASAALGRADALAADAGGPEELSQQVGGVRADLAMALRLEAIRLGQAAVKEGRDDLAGADRQYREAFEGYGLEFTTIDPDQAAERIHASAAEGQLLAGIDDWLSVRGRLQRPGFMRLFEVVQRVDADAWRNQFREAMRRRDVKAMTALARDPSLVAQPPATVASLATRLRRARQLPLAIEVLRSAQQRHPDDFWVNEDLGVSCMEREPALAGEALACFRAALALRPDSAPVRMNVGNALAELGRLTEAESELRLATQSDPDLALGHYNLGNVLQRKGDLPGAVAAYDRAIALNPGHAEAHCNRGNALLKKDDYPGAEAAYRKAIDLQPDHPEAFNGLGLARLGQNDPAGALAAARTAVELRPESPEVWNGLGRVLAARDDLPGAAAAFRKAVAARPGFVVAHYNLGYALLRQGDPAGAGAAFQKAIAAAPDSADAHYNLGNARDAEGDWRAAAAAYRAAIAVKPDFAEAHCNLGHTLRRLGDFAESLAELRRGHELGTREKGWRYPSLLWVRQGERLVELDGQLAGFLAGTTTPASTQQRIELAQLCRFKGLNRAATRFFEDAFAAESASAPRFLPAHRFPAACAAAQAGCGRGGDAADLDDRERQRLRALALRWLREGLTYRVKSSGPNAPALQLLSRVWQRDPELACVRDEPTLNLLPDSERQAWKKLWADVAALREPAAPK
jgi:serine/threonine protein kinase/Flp pilus assembly protein TadD